MMTPATMVIPRWEWRTFAPSLGSLRRAVGGIPLGAPRESHEIHVLCLRSSHSTRVHDGLMDLKWRKQVDADGLELWDPVLKSEFPFDASFVPRLFEAWGLRTPALARPGYTLAQFLDEIVTPDPVLRAVAVTAERQVFTLGGTNCELARLTADGVPLETFCAEHEDPALVLQAVRGLGLDSRHNINTPMGLKRALALAAA
jgi:exopolyphosphatase / guanosine-5'-triphosphate,3'-diphosphate pyrophosphatase